MSLGVLLAAWGTVLLAIGAANRRGASRLDPSDTSWAAQRRRSHVEMGLVFGVTGIGVGGVLVLADALGASTAVTGVTATVAGVAGLALVGRLRRWWFPTGWRPSEPMVRFDVLRRGRR
jgi:hypothetical protein